LKRIILSFFITSHLAIYLFTTISRAQTLQVPDSLKKHFQKSFAITHIATAGLTLTGLYSLWYKDYQNSSFHFFNDNNEWMGIDKLGHAYTNFHITRELSKQYYYAGLSNHKSLLLGWSISNAYFLTIELMDGYSTGWGFSYGDILANIAGSSLAAAQQYFWNEEPIQFKFLYSPSPYPTYRPNVLGKNFQSKLLKDYNAQSYWLCLSPIAFTNKYTNNWLSALQLAFGYGANGMVAASAEKQKELGYHFLRYRQYFFSVDINWDKIPVKNKNLKKWLHYLNVIKIPLPYFYITNTKTGFSLLPKY
jgi:hypothetical protein